MQRWPRRARGSTGASGAVRWRRCRASGEAWLDGEDEGGVAMLVDTSGRRGEHGGCVYGVRRRRAPLGFGRARGGERAARREEVQRVEGGCVATHGGVQGVGDAGS